MSVSRETGRDALVVLLEAALVGTGLPAKTVTGSKVEDLSGLTPLVSVLSAGTLRERLSFGVDTVSFSLEIQVWVRQVDTGQTYAQAEDILDDIEALIAGVFEDNRGTTNWAALEYNGSSSVLEVDVGGVLYYVERTPTLVKLA